MGLAPWLLASLSTNNKPIAPLTKALAKSPHNLGTLNSLGTCYMATGNSELAIKTYKQALEITLKAQWEYLIVV
jgi:Flp pilus assembly protein TadD